jgi:putative DNA-invertase from lambdoid prophage Rac
MKVVGYCRVGTAEDVSIGDSVAAQKQQITRYCMMRGWREPEFFVDAGVSGSVPLAERPGGRRLLAALTKGDVVIAAKFDRAFRSTANALSTLEELKAAGVALHIIDLGGDVTVSAIISAMAENERDRTRERIRDVKRHKASQGIYHGGQRPFGYSVVGGFLFLEDKEQAAIARMIALRRRDRPYKEISKTIAKEFEIEMQPMTIKRILDRAEKKSIR